MRIIEKLIIESDYDFRCEDLRGCDFRGVDLRRVNLKHTELQGADLRGANLEGNYYITVAKTEGAIYDDSTIFPEDVNPEDLGMVYEAVN